MNILIVEVILPGYHIKRSNTPPPEFNYQNLVDNLPIEIRLTYVKTDP